MSKPVKIVLALVVLAVAVGGAAFWFLRDDAPDEVDLDAAVDALDDDEDGDDESDGAGDVDVEGTWVIDTDLAPFSFDDSDQGTYVGFRVQEELTSVGAATAVGRTPGVSGELTIEGTTLTAADFTADLSAITTNQSMRDGRVRGALATDQFPEATFTLTETLELGEAAAEGGPVTVTATGDLTIKGITQPITIDLEAQVSGSTLVVVGSTEITFADWHVQVPSAPVVVSAEDHGILEVQLLLSKA